MMILDSSDMTFDAVGVFGLDFWLLFESGSSYCDVFSTFSRHNLCNLNVKFTSWIQVLPCKEAVFEEKKSWESDKSSIYVVAIFRALPPLKSTHISNSYDKGKVM